MYITKRVKFIWFYLFYKLTCSVLFLYKERFKPSMVSMHYIVQWSIIGIFVGETFGVSSISEEKKLSMCSI